MEGTCGGKGTCGKCRVRIQKGDRGEFTAAEKKHLSPAERDRGMALACQCCGQGDLEIYLPTVRADLSRKTKKQKKKVVVATDLEKIYLELAKPSTRDQRSDERRLLDALGEKVTGPLQVELMRRLPSLLRKAQFKVTAVVAHGEILAVEAGDTTGELYGIAFDIGTTTVVGSLVDFSSGQVLATSSWTNEQNVYGADVISRIQYTVDNPDGLSRLQQVVVEVLNKITGQLVAASGIEAQNIYQVTAVANTTMSHLLLGMPPENLAPSPFVPVFQSQVTLAARELGLRINPGGQTLVLPNVAGYVGSDTVGVMLAASMDQKQKPTLAIDIGTNGEIVLARGEKLFACSTAAGPAFEGAQIRCGMRAAAGAIEAVRIGEEVELDVIGNVPATGICGSGLIDAIAEMLKAGIIDNTGRIVAAEELQGKLSEELVRRVRMTEDGWEFVLSYGESGENDVVLTQKDVRELQLAKGAIRAGAEILLQDAGIAAGELDKVLLAGAFGNYIKKESALKIGLLPQVTIEKVRSIGNAAGDGSLLALASVEQRERAQRLARSVKHIELSTRQEFMEAFMSAMYFSESNPISVG